MVHYEKAAYYSCHGLRYHLEGPCSHYFVLQLGSGARNNKPVAMPPDSVIFFPINAPGMGRFQLLNLGVLGYGLELRFWVVIAIIVSLTLTITLITTLTII